MNDSLLKIQNDLNHHALFSEIKSPAQLRFFMESHVFAVWDFMSLLKRLQRELTCVEVPWTPSKYPEKIVRFINQIVVGEESDEDLNGNAISHFNLYLQAMDEVGASTVTIREFLKTSNMNLIPDQSKEFTEFTLKTAKDADVVEVAAAFFYGREKLIPGMFDGIISSLKSEGLQCPTLLYYLERHIQVDGDEHGPLGELCLEALCGNDPALRARALSYGLKSLEERKKLWDKTLLKMSL